MNPKLIATCFVAAITLLVACGEGIDGDHLGTQEQPVISDGSHDGREGFYFLPPLVPEPSPHGMFDATLEPVIEIREIGSDDLVAEFGREGVPPIVVDVAEEHYQVDWHAGESDIEPGNTYRISVLVNDQSLGFADLQVVGTGRELRNVDRDEYVPLKDGRTLPIKFRIESGVLCSDETGSCLVRVPEEAATVQEAVDLVNDRGVVLLAPGTYSETVAIVGKHVDLIGDPSGGPQSVRFVAPPPTVVQNELRRSDIITYGPRSGGRLANLALIGGNAAVRGPTWGGGTTALSIDNVSIERNDHGIVGSWSSVKLRDTSILDTVVAAYQACGGNHRAVNAVMQNSGSYGMYVQHCGNDPTVVTIESSNISNNAQGGLAVVGNVYLVVTESVFDTNNAFGIFLGNVSNALLINATVTDTLTGMICGVTDCYDNLAEGLIGVLSNVVLIDCHFEGHDRSGLLLETTTARAITSLISADRFGAVLQFGASLTLVDTVVFGGEETFVHDGALPIPEAPPIPE